MKDEGIVGILPKRGVAQFVLLFCKLPIKTWHHLGQWIDFGCSFVELLPKCNANLPNFEFYSKTAGSWGFTHPIGVSKLPWGG